PRLSRPCSSGWSYPRLSSTKLIARFSPDSRFARFRMAEALGYPQWAFPPQVGLSWEDASWGGGRFAHMFDQLVEAATGSRAPAAVGAWARVENAACARRLAAVADELDRLRGEDGSADRELWCIDNWDAVAASVAAAQQVSLGVASHQLSVAVELRDLPRVEEVFAAGAISYRLVAAVIARTRLIGDRDARAKVDSALAARIRGWGALSVAKTETQIDYWV